MELSSYTKIENDKLDVIIFGATGFSGKRVVIEAANLIKQENFTFGIAGRNEEKLKMILKECSPDLIPIIIADVKDEQSINKMAEKGKVIINCCGPYNYYGETVIKACIAAKTNYVDIAAEPSFIEEMELKYNQAAQNAGVYIITSCGFDTIPSDLGVIFTQKQFNGEVNSIEEYVTIPPISMLGKPITTVTTFKSLLCQLNYIGKLRQIRSKLFSTKLPELKPKLIKKSYFPHKSPLTNDLSSLFPSADDSVINRTQRYLYQKYNQRPAQVAVYFSVKMSFLLQVLGIFLLFINMILVKFSYGRNLIFKYPKFFTYGFVSHKGPSDKTLKEMHISMTFIARGWTKKLNGTSGFRVDQPNKEMITKVTGVDPYLITASCAFLSGYIISKESDKMPPGGGVLTAGAAFSNTSLLDELNRHCLKFTVISTTEK